VTPHLVPARPSHRERQPGLARDREFGR
jgi:hypothetical protein